MEEGMWNWLCEPGHWPALQQGSALSFWALMPLISPIREASAQTRTAQGVLSLFWADLQGAGKQEVGEEVGEPTCTFMCISPVCLHMTFLQAHPVGRFWVLSLSPL